MLPATLSPAARARVVAVSAGLACALVAGDAAAQSGDDWLGADKALHFTASALAAGGGYGLAAVAWQAPSVRVFVAAGVGIAAGVGKELIDLAGYGDPSWRDLAWDALGVGVGVTVAWLIDRAMRTPAGSPRRAAWGLAPSLARAGAGLAWYW